MERQIASVVFGLLRGGILLVCQGFRKILKACVFATLLADRGQGDAWWARRQFGA